MSTCGTKILYGIFLFIPIIMIVLIEVEIFSNVDLGQLRRHLEGDAAQSRGAP
ncbi:MAG: hypothetical protein U0176_14125 [Bacteroidia bacterium]